MTRFLDVVEWLGNLLPHPVTLFALFAVGIVLLSGVLDWIGLAVPDPRPADSPNRSPSGMIEVVSLLNGEGLRRITQNLVTNFTGFVPLGTVLVAMLGVGVAEKSGLLSAMIRGIVLNAPRHAVTVALVFAGVLSNTASEMGYVVLVPLAAAVFYSLGRHPLAGMAAAFAGVSGGYSANLLLGTIDPLLAGITQEAARLIDPAYEVHPAVNWYFMIVSTFLITGLGWFVTEKIVEPRLGPYDVNDADETAAERHASDEEPFASDFGLRDQIRRAAVSVMSNIAEGFNSRTQKRFIDYLGRARGSAAEVQSQLYLARDRGYVSEEQFHAAYDLADTASRQIHGLIRYLKSQPNSSRVEEETIHYEIDDDHV